MTPDQCKQKCSILEVNDIIGGLWVPGDGVGDPHEICKTLIDESIKMGVTVIEHCAITEVIQENRKVKAVKTSGGGTTECVYFVNCSGFWARGIGQLSEPYVKVPLHAAEHYYLHTKLIDGLDPMTPIVRDLDGQIYFREHKGAILAGGFELNAKPAYEDGIIPCMCKF